MPAVIFQLASYIFRYTYGMDNTTPISPASQINYIVADILVRFLYTILFLYCLIVEDKNLHIV